MTRDLPLGNGNLLVTFDSDYNLRDIYYPHVGKANQSSACVSRTGVWVDGKFSWLQDSSWQKSLDYVLDTLATRVVLTNEELGLRLQFNDAVDFSRDIFLRRVEVFNLEPRPREVRLFFHYEFLFWEVGRGDTIYYDPEGNNLVAYKDDCYFLLNGALGDQIGVVDWTTGHKDGGEGEAWLDPDAGILKREGISFGTVEGVVAVHEPVLPANGSSAIYAWIAAGRSLDECQSQNRFVTERKPQYLLTRTMNYWRAWLNKEETDMHDLSPEFVRLYQRSLLIIRSQVDNGGGIIAAGESGLTAIAHGQESYAYVWPRDGAYTANALDKAGYAFLASRFYDFCRNVISHQPVESDSQNAYEESTFMLHKYTPDGRMASSWMSLVDESGQPQLPIQEDGTALLPYALWRHYRKFRDIELFRPLFRPLVLSTGNFMVDFREPKTGLPAPSYDLWEEKRGIYSYTVATVWAGLTAAANLANLFGEKFYVEKFQTAAAEIKQACETHLYDDAEGRFLKSVSIGPGVNIQKDPTVDASLYALWYFGMFDPKDPRIERTMQAVTDRLSCQTQIGGIARYEGDAYHWDETLQVDRAKIPGNPWFITTLWQAQYQIAKAESLDELTLAIPFLQWACERALPSGVMAEQLHPLTGEPVSVSPLTWSHATFVAAVQEYLEKFEHLSRTLDA